MNIRELTERQMQISDLLEETEGEVSAEIQDLIDIKEEGEKNCVDWFGTMCAQATATSGMLLEEIKRLQAKKKVCDNKVSRLKTYMTSYMVANGISKIDGQYYKASVRSADAVEVTDEAALASEARAKVESVLAAYPWLTAEIKVNKSIIKTMEDIPDGAEIVKHQSVTFR